MLHAYGLDIPRTLEEICNPARMALLVYDMQIGVLNQIKNAAEVTASVVRVVNAARDASMRVIFFRHLSLPKELMGVFQFRMAADLGYIPVVIRDACGAGHQEAGERSIACMDYTGDAIFTDVETFIARLSKCKV